MPPPIPPHTPFYIFSFRSWIAHYNHAGIETENKRRHVMYLYIQFAWEKEGQTTPSSLKVW